MPDGIGVGTIWAALALRLEGLFQNAQQATQIMSQLEANMQQSATRSSASASEALRIDQASWKARIAAAGQGTAQQKAIVTEYLTWLRTQLARTDLTPGMTAALQNQVATVIRQMDTMARQATAAAESARAAQERAAAQAAAAAERAAKAQAAAQARAAKQAEAAAARAAAVQQQMAEQTLRVEMSQWKMRVAATAQGTAEQKAILAQYHAWLQTQSAIPGMRPGALTAVNNEIAAVTRQMNNLGKETQTVGGQMEATFGRIQRTLGAILAVEVFRYVGQALTQLPQLAFQTQAGFRILERQAEATGQSLDRVHTSMERLATDLHTAKEALAQPVAELMRYGYTIEQIEGIFRGAAASGLLMGKTIDQSIKLVSEALISQRSVLLNEIGIVENLDTAMNQYAKSLGKTADDLTASERAMASYQMVVRVTANEVRDLPILMEGYGGATAEAGQATYRLKQAVGEALLPVMTQLKMAFAGMIESATPFMAALASMADKVIPMLVTVISYRLVASLQILKVKLLEVALAGEAVKLAINPVAAVIAAVAAALVYFGIQSAAAKRSAEALGGSVDALTNKYSQEAAQAQKSIRTSIEKARALQDEKRLLDQYLPTLDSFRGKENLTAEESDNLKSALNALAERFPWLDTAISTTSENFDNALRALHDYRTGINQTMADILTSMNMVAGLKLPELEQQLAEQERMLQEARRLAMELTQYQAVRDPFAMTDILRRWGVGLKDGQTIFDQFAEELQRRSGEAASNIQTLADSVAHTRVAIEQLQQAQKDYATFRATGWLPELPKPVIEESTPTGKEKTALQLWQEEAAVFKQTIALATAGYGDLTDALTKYRDFLRATADDTAREHEVRAAAASELKGILSDLVQVELDAFEQLKANGDAAVDTYEEQIAYLQGIIDKSAELQMQEEDRAAIEAEIWQTRNAQYEAEARKAGWTAQQQLDGYRTMVAAHAISVDQRLEAEAKIADLTARMNDAAYRAAMDSYERRTIGLELSAARRLEIFNEEVVAQLAGIKLVADTQAAIERQILQLERAVDQESIAQEEKTINRKLQLQQEALRATGQARQAAINEARQEWLGTLGTLQNELTAGLIDDTTYWVSANAAYQKYMGDMANLGLEALRDAFEQQMKGLSPAHWEVAWEGLRKAFEQQFAEQFPGEPMAEWVENALRDMGIEVSKIPDFVVKKLDEMGEEISATYTQKEREIAALLAGAQASALEAAGQAMEAAIVRENERYAAALHELQQTGLPTDSFEYKEALANIESEHRALLQAINVMYSADITLAGAMAKALGDNQELAEAEAQVEQLKTALQDLVKRGIGGKELDDAVAALSAANDKLNELSLADALKKIGSDAEQQKQALEAQKLLGMTEAQYLQAQANIVTQQINATVTQLLAAGRTQEEATAYVKELIDEANKLIADAKTATRQADIDELMKQYNFDMGVTTPGKGAVSLARQIAEWIGPSADLAEAEKKLELTEQLIQQLIALGEPLDSARMQELFSWWGAYWLEVKNLTETVDATVKAQEAIKRAKERISETSDKQRQALVDAGLLSETEALKEKLDDLKAALEAYVLHAENAGIASEEAAETVTLLREQIQGLSADIEEDEAFDKWIEKLQELKDAYDEATGSAMWLEEELAKANGETFDKATYMQQFLTQHIKSTAAAWLAEGKSIEVVMAVLAPLLAMLKQYNEEAEKTAQEDATKDFWAGWRADLLQTVGGSFYTALNAGWEAWKVTGASEKLKPLFDELKAEWAEFQESALFKGLIRGFDGFLSMLQTAKQMAADTPRLLYEEVFRIPQLKDLIKERGLLGGIGQAIKDMLHGLGLGLATFFEGPSGNWITKSLGQSIQGFIDKTVSVAESVVGAIGGFFAKIDKDMRLHVGDKDIVADVWTVFSDMVKRAIPGTFRVLDKITEPLRNMFAAIGGWISKLFKEQNIGVNVPMTEEQKEAMAALAGPMAAVFSQLVGQSEKLQQAFGALNVGVKALADAIGTALLALQKAIGPEAFGALSGAGIGLALAGPIGAAIGAVVGLLGGIMGRSAEEQRKAAEAQQRAAEAWREFLSEATAGELAHTYQELMSQIEKAWAKGIEAWQWFEHYNNDVIQQYLEVWDKLKEILSTTAAALRNAVKSAFDAGSLAEGMMKLGQSLQDVIKNAIITAFLESAAMKPLFDNLSDAITNAVLDGVLTAEELANLKALQGPIADKLAAFWTSLKELGLMPKGSGSSDSGSRGLQVTHLTGESRQLFVELLRPITQLPAIMDRLLQRIDDAVNMVKQMTQGIGLEIQDATITILRATVTIQSADVVYVNGPVYGGGGMTSLGGAIRSGA